MNFEKLKRRAKETFQSLMDNQLKTVMLAVCLFLFLTLAIVSFRELFFRLRYETKEIGNYDSYLYYTVGHALSEGLKPYAEMYENKPPLIFLLSAISYKLLKNYYLVNLFSFFSFLTILLTPLIYIIIFAKKRKTPLVIAILTLIFALATSTMLTIFSEENSGEVQIEAFGTACVMLSILFATLTERKKPTKYYSWQVILSGVFLGFATMFKEPFILIGIIALLLLTHSKKDLLYRIVCPCFYAIITSFLILLSTNCLVPYFTIYLKNMFSSHLTIYGSPFERMKNIGAIFNYIRAFSPSLNYIFIFVFIFSTINEFCRNYSTNSSLNIILKIINGLKPLAFLFVTSFVVGLGGQYYNHHYVFAIGYFAAMLISTCDFILKIKPDFSLLKHFVKEKDNFQTAITNENQTKISTTNEQAEVINSVEIENTDSNKQDNPLELAQTKPELNQDESKQTVERISMKVIKSFYIYAVIIIMILLECAAFTKTNDYVSGTDYVISASQSTKENAVYIDEILDELGEENYLWIGFNGYNPYAYTKHLPLGASFVQDVNNFASKDTFFAIEFQMQLLDANVLIVQSYPFNLGALTNSTNSYVLENFSILEPESIKNANLSRPIEFSALVFYRNKTFD